MYVSLAVMEGLIHALLLCNWEVNTVAFMNQQMHKMESISLGNQSVIRIFLHFLSVTWMKRRVKQQLLVPNVSPGQLLQAAAATAHTSSQLL